MIKRSIAAVLVSLIANLHAEDACLPDYTPSMPLCDETACGIYTQYAGVQLECAWDITTWAEFLYWRPIRTDAWAALEVAETSEFGVPALGTTQKELALTFGYRPAFRAGFAIHLPCFDNWFLNADYTWYHHKFVKTFRAQEPAFLASTTAAGTPLVIPIYSSIKNLVNFDYDIVCLSVQRPNYIGQKVILSPFFGLKWMHRVGKIKQEATRGFDIDVARAYLHYDSVGLAAGFDGSLLLCWNLRLIGKSDVGIMYGYHSKFAQTTTFNLFGPDLQVDLGQTDKHIDILARGGMGLGWGNYFCANRYRLDLSLTYDFLADIVKMAFSTGMIENSSTMLTGLTVRGQFDF